MIYFVGFFAIILPLWVLAPRAESHQVWTSFNDKGKWGSDGTATLVGMSGLITTMAGFDCAVHMGEHRVHQRLGNVAVTWFRGQRKKLKMLPQPCLMPLFLVLA